MTYLAENKASNNPPQYSPKSGLDSALCFTQFEISNGHYDRGVCTCAGDDGQLHCGGFCSPRTSQCEARTTAVTGTLTDRAVAANM